jgi:glycerophosphoryl diester phosphodiesterase
MEWIAPRAPEVAVFLRRTLLRSPALLMALLLPGCAWHHPRPSDSLFPSSPVVMGHRGARGLAPENTMPAFRKAAALGVPFELDTMLCASGELVVIHDWELDRLAGVPGRVVEKPWSELAGLDVGRHFAPEAAGAGIPLLEDVLRELTPQVLVNIEVKADRSTDNAVVAETLVTLLEALGVKDRVIVTSFSPLLLEAVRLRDPSLLRGQIYRGFSAYEDSSFAEKLVLSRLLFNGKAQPDLLMMDHQRARPRYVRRMKRRGYRIFTWTVNEPERALELFAMGVDGVITDYPDRLLPLLQGAE